MRFIVGRHSARKRFSIKKYLHQGHSNFSDDFLLSCGEPFLIGGHKNGRPAISALGPGTFWLKKTQSIKTVGEAFNPKDLEELADVLEARRGGDVFGRWYSSYCKDGELGFIPFNMLEEITYAEFEKVKNEF